MMGAAPDYRRYYMSQCGFGLPYYQGPVHQRGHGIGNILRGAFRTVGSIIAPSIKNVGGKILKGVASDVLRGNNLKTAITKRALSGVQSGAHALVDTAFNRIAKTGIKRPAPTHSSRPAKVRKKVGRRGKTRRQTGRGGDIFS